MISKDGPYLLKVDTKFQLVQLNNPEIKKLKFSEVFVLSLAHTHKHARMQTRAHAFTISRAHINKIVPRNSSIWPLIIFFTSYLSFLINLTLFLVYLCILCPPHYTLSRFTNFALLINTHLSVHYFYPTLTLKTAALVTCWTVKKWRNARP